MRSDDVNGGDPGNADDGPIERVPMRFTTEDIDVSSVIIPRGIAVDIGLGAVDRMEVRSRSMRCCADSR
jgi:hypothetical protein